ncbi:MAG TPA: RHS repeat-associated core domain-containing protein [Verrucomicrobiae bacterium]
MPTIHDQPTTVVDANGVSVTQDFDWLGQMLHRTVPGQNQEVFQYSGRGLTDYWGPDTRHTQYGYDEALRKTSEITPKSENIAYAYNAGGDLLTLTDGRNKVTTWTNDIEGLVRAKKYHGQTFANITYSYDANQRLTWRNFWSSPTVFKQTFYGYDDAGNLLTIDYPASPDVSFTYNENNQPLTMTTAGLGTTTYTYTDAGNLWTEGGIWANDTVTNTYHASVPRLRTGLTLKQPALTWSQSYAFDAADRLQTITSPAGTFTYTYRGAGTLWTNLVVPTSPASAITNAYDSAARLTRTAVRGSSGVLNVHDYLYNTAGQRQRQTLTDSSYTTYGFDDDAQLTNSLGYLQNGTPIAAEQLGFAYDQGWNMTGRAVNGAPTSYTVNDLNEATAVGSLPCTYDQNGNRITYGQGSGTTQYTYDDENRLIRVSYSTAYRTDFTYDALSRLRVRTEYTYYYGQWNVSSVTRYIYDGKRAIQERSGNNTPTVTHTRGKDLSGSLEGAGGIGGLLARSGGYSGGTWTSHAFYHADGNGNITCMVDSGQSVVASYKYDPYGRTISSSGTLAAANLYRFSSKELHVNSGLYYYLYRFYDPNTQRWLNRDPLGEAGDINLYTMVGNWPTTSIDPFGLRFPRGQPPRPGRPRDPHEPGGEGPCDHPAGEGDMDWYRSDPMEYGYGKLGGWCGKAFGNLLVWLWAPPVYPAPAPQAPPHQGCSICPVNAPPPEVPRPPVPRVPPPAPRPDPPRAPTSTISNCSENRPIIFPPI